MSLALHFISSNMLDIQLFRKDIDAVAQRLAGLESALLRRQTGELAPIIEAYGFAELTPIDDVRGSADYRRSAAREIVARAVARAARSCQPTRDAA